MIHILSDMCYPITVYTVLDARSSTYPPTWLHSESTYRTILSYPILSYHPILTCTLSCMHLRSVHDTRAMPPAGLIRMMIHRLTNEASAFSSTVSLQFQNPAFPSPSQKNDRYLLNNAGLWWDFLLTMFPKMERIYQCQTRKCQVNAQHSTPNRSIGQ